MLQWTIKLRVIARQRAGKKPLAQNAHLYRRSPAGYKERVESLSAKGEVLTIYGRPYEVVNSPHSRDRYAQEASRPPQVLVHAIGIHPIRDTTQKPGDIDFTEVDVN